MTAKELELQYKNGIPVKEAIASGHRDCRYSIATEYKNDPSKKGLSLYRNGLLIVTPCKEFVFDPQVTPLRGNLVKGKIFFINKNGKDLLEWNKSRSRTRFAFDEEWKEYFPENKAMFFSNKGYYSVSEVPSYILRKEIEESADINNIKTECIKY